MLPNGGCWAIDKGRVVVYNSEWQSLEPIRINAAAKPACLTVTPDNSVAMVCRRTVTLWTPSGTLTSTFTHPDFKVCLHPSFCKSKSISCSHERYITIKLALYEGFHLVIQLFQAGLLSFMKQSNPAFY